MFIIKMPTQFCENCNFKTTKLSNWSKHLNTIKHIIRCIENDEETKNEEKTKVEIKPNKYSCEICKYKTGKKQNYMTHMNSTKHLQALEIFHTKMQDSQPSTIINNINNTNNINNNYNNNCNNIINKNRFNLNIFLNEECKDAINITDFINNISLTLADLEQTTKLGYTAGITKIINDRIQDIGVKKRPYHCTDKKRETVYVKDCNLWEKEPDDKPKMKKMIAKIIHKNIEQLSAWKEANPECNDLTNRKGEEYLSMMIEANGGNRREEKEERIMKNVLENVNI